MAEAVFIEHGFEFFQNLGQGALALGEGEAAGGQGHAREGVQAQAGAFVFLVEAVLGEDRLDARLHLGRDAADAEVLGRREAEVAGVDFGDFAKGGFHRPALAVHNASAEDMEAVEPISIGAFVPTEGILDGGEMNRTRRREGDARAFLDLAFEPLDAAILDRVFQAGVLAVCAVAEVALRGENGLADFVHQIGRDEAERVGQAREGLGVSMAHAEPAANGDIVADEFAVFDDGDVAEVLGVNVHIVRGREDEAGLEFAREVSVAIHRLALGLAAGDEFLVEVDFVVGAGFWEGKFAPGLRVVIDLLRGGAALGIRRGHDIAVHIAAGRDGIEEDLVHALDELFDIALEDAVKLEGLARGEAERGGGNIAREFVEDEPLVRGGFAAGETDTEHERERLFLAGFLEGHAEVAVVLQIEPVEFRELAGVVRDRARGGVGEFLGDAAAEVVRRGFEWFVRAEGLGFGGGVAHGIRADTLLKNPPFGNAILGGDKAADCIGERAWIGSRASGLGHFSSRLRRHSNTP